WGGGGVTPPSPPYPPENHILASKGDLCHSKSIKRAKKRAFDIGGGLERPPRPVRSNGSFKIPFKNIFNKIYSFSWHDLFLLYIRKGSKHRTGGARVAFLSRPAIIF